MLGVLWPLCLIAKSFVLPYLVYGDTFSGYIDYNIFLLTHQQFENT